MKTNQAQPSQYAAATFSNQHEPGNLPEKGNKKKRKINNKFTRIYNENKNSNHPPTAAALLRSLSLPRSLSFPVLARRILP